MRKLKRQRREENKEESVEIGEDCSWQTLPTECLLLIFSALEEARALTLCRLVSSRWRDIVDNYDESIWRPVCRRRSSVLLRILFYQSWQFERWGDEIEIERITSSWKHASLSSQEGIQKAERLSKRSERSRVRLSHSELSTLPFNILRKEVKELSLKDNLFQELPLGLENCSQLTSLDISANHLKNVTRTQVQSLQKSLSPLVHLTSLQVLSILFYIYSILYSIF